MREKKWTPGPWERVYRDFGCYRIDGPDVWMGGATSIPSEQHHANAHLIASAPELLEALEGAIRFMNDVEGGNDTRMQSHDVRTVINKAIAKAYGATP